MPIQMKLWTAKRVVRLACWNKKDLIVLATFIGATGACDFGHTLALACSEGQTERRGPDRSDWAGESTPQSYFMKKRRDWLV